MKEQESLAVKVALAHINAWSHHNWDKTKELLAPSVHAVVTGTERDTTDFSGIDNYMERKKKGAQLVESGSVQIISAIGDEVNASVVATMKIALGPNGTLVTMTRACLYLLDENGKIKEERDSFYLTY